MIVNKASRYFSLLNIVIVLLILSLCKTEITTRTLKRGYHSLVDEKVGYKNNDYEDSNGLPFTTGRPNNNGMKWQRRKFLKAKITYFRSKLLAVGSTSEETQLSKTRKSVSLEI